VEGFFGDTSPVGQASACLLLNFADTIKIKRRQAEQAAEKLDVLSFLSEAKNLSFFELPVLTIEERFFASLRMTT
jgi:hypothetical protein